MEIVDVESGYLGAATHGALVIVAFCEGMTFKSRSAKFLAGCVAGWHAYAVLYHLQERQKERQSRKENA